MIMAAGLGTRMHPLTRTMPKALVPCAGKSLIDHMLDALADAGVRRVVVNVHHHAGLLIDHLALRQAPDIIISDERDHLLETGGGFVRARPQLGDDPVLTCNVDALFAEAAGATGFLYQLADAWQDTDDALLLLARRDRSLGLETAGDFHRDPDGVLSRRGSDATADYYYAGVQIIRPQLIGEDREDVFSMNRFWDRALARGSLRGAVFEGDWYHVGDPLARDATDKALSARRSS